MTSALERGIFDAIGSLVSDRVYPVELPDIERAFPAIVYQVIDNPRQSTQSGDSGTTFARIQFRLYGSTYAECCTLRDSFVAFCASQQVPPFVGIGSPAVILGGWFIDSEQDEGAAAPLKDSGVRLWSKRLDVIIHTADL